MFILVRPGLLNQAFLMNLGKTRHLTQSQLDNHLGSYPGIP